MTSEILIMNDTCIALAADSASTVGHKIFSADKIFELSRNQPIAVMTYGTASISSVKLEILVKEFRRSIGDKRFETVRSCSEAFLKFIETGGSKSYRTNPIITKDHVADTAFYCYLRIIRYIERQFNDMMKNSLFSAIEKGQIDGFQEKASECLEQIILEIENTNRCSNFRKRQLVEKGLLKIITREESDHIVDDEILPLMFADYYGRIVRILASMITNKCM